MKFQSSRRSFIGGVSASLAMTYFPAFSQSKNIELKTGQEPVLDRLSLKRLDEATQLLAELKKNQDSGRLPKYLQGGLSDLAQKSSVILERLEGGDSVKVLTKKEISSFWQRCHALRRSANVAIRNLDSLEHKEENLNYWTNFYADTAEVFEILGSDSANYPQQLEQVMALRQNLSKVQTKEQQYFAARLGTLKARWQDEGAGSMFKDRLKAYSNKYSGFSSKQSDIRLLLRYHEMAVANNFQSDLPADNSGRIASNKKLAEEISSYLIKFARGDQVAESPYSYYFKLEQMEEAVTNPFDVMAAEVVSGIKRNAVKVLIFIGAAAGLIKFIQRKSDNHATARNEEEIKAMLKRLGKDEGTW